MPVRRGWRGAVGVLPGARSVQGQGLRRRGRARRPDEGTGPSVHAPGRFRGTVHGRRAFHVQGPRRRRVAQRRRRRRRHPGHSRVRRHPSPRSRVGRRRRRRVRQRGGGDAERVEGTGESGAVPTGRRGGGADQTAGAGMRPSHAGSRRGGAAEHPRTRPGRRTLEKRGEGACQRGERCERSRKYGGLFEGERDEDEQSRVERGRPDGSERTQVVGVGSGPGGGVGAKGSGQAAVVGHGAHRRVGRTVRDHAHVRSESVGLVS
mmetsp:Transcript_590/g.2309  ORF Transcript_590/g.2309 Transcript_590/m.2309 type:complete len:263 (+) Transcript_590:568-1356(+)